MPGKSTQQTVAHSIQLRKVQTAYRILAPRDYSSSDGRNYIWHFAKGLHALPLLLLTRCYRTRITAYKRETLLDSLALEPCGTTSLSTAGNLDLTEVRVIFVFGFEKRKGLDNFLMLCTIYRY